MKALAYHALSDEAERSSPLKNVIAPHRVGNTNVTSVQQINERMKNAWRG